MENIYITVVSDVDGVQSLAIIMMPS